MKNLVIAVASLMTITSFGDTFYVDGSVEASGDGSQGSPVKTVAEGVALAVNDGDIVEIAKGTYPITETIEITHPITVRGATGNPDDVVIDGVTKAFPIMNVQATAGAAKILSLTVYRGRGVNGGGTATNCRGGGFTLWSGATVSNCVATGAGQKSNSGRGGFLVCHADALVTHCRIHGNDVSGGTGNGAGVNMTAGTLADSLIYGNKCKANGGGVFLDNGGIVRNCTIADNSAATGGGVCFNISANPKCRLYNSIVLENTATGTGANIGASKGKPGSYVANCASSGTEYGSGYVDLGETIPYDEEYRLTKAGNALVGGQGDPALVNGVKDFFGTARPTDESGVVTATDIGCAQYVPSEVKSVRFEASPRTGVGPTTVTFVATPDGGLDLDAADCTWYLNGEPVEGEKDATMTKTLPPGFYSAKFVAIDVDGTYVWEEPDRKYVFISPPDIYIAPGGDGEAPYDAPEKASSNLLAVVNDYKQSGVTVHVAAGRYPLSAALNIPDGVRVIGKGLGESVLYATGKEYSVLTMNGTGAYAEGLCLSNSSGRAGLAISGRGGHFTRGRIVKCTGQTNQPGGGAQLSCDEAILSHSVIANNETKNTGTYLHPGGGVSIEGGRMDDCLVISNKAAYAGGVLVSKGGTLANCTVIGNTTHMELASDVPGGGGICRTAGSVYNCIAYGNKENGSEAPEGQIRGSVTACRTEDPKFLDAANGDYRIGGSSPCAYAGVYQSWMDGATDFFGNPRTTPGKKVSIGYCQAPGPGLMLLVR